MIERVDDVEAYINALLDITDNNYIEAVFIVCKDIELKEPQVL